MCILWFGCVFLFGESIYLSDVAIIIISIIIIVIGNNKYDLAYDLRVIDLEVYLPDSLSMGSCLVDV